MKLRANPILQTKMRIIDPEDFDSPNVIRDERGGPELKRLFRRETARQFIGKVSPSFHSQRFTRIRFLLDFSFQRRQPALIAHVRELFGNGALVVTKNHCKFALFGNAAWRITCRTSMNLNFNPRLEDVELEDDPKLFGFLEAILDEIFSKTNVRGQQSAKTRELSREFAALEI